MERFISELTSIYEAAGASTHSDPVTPKTSPVALDMRGKHEPASPSPRVTPYIPAHRVA
jgi:hypothetical protein